MKVTEQIAQLLRAVNFGGNWTSVNLKETLADLTWREATTVIDPFNTTAAFVFHINYYVCAILRVLHGNEIDAHDKYSFALSPIQSQQDWENLISKTSDDAENFAAMVEQFPDAKLEKIFINDQYGNYYRNFHGVIEHTHYHLGQIVL